MAGWIAVGIAVVGTMLTLLGYLNQRRKKRLSYVVTESTELIPKPLRDADLYLSVEGHTMENPALSIVRIVNTGNLPITAQDFETALGLTFEGVDEIASASCTATRPGDLNPQVSISEVPVLPSGRIIEIAPQLINPGDMIQLQVLSSGKPEKVEMSGRVTDLIVEQRERLPYPPGSGKEGEFTTAIDYFMWWIMWPTAILALGLAFGLSNDRDFPTEERVAIVASVVVVALILYPLYARYLIRRRAMWRP